MPRPAKNLEPVVIEAARSISSNSLSLTSPPSSSTESAWGVPIHHANTMNQLTAWGLQWDSIDEQVYDKDEINLSMSVRPRVRHMSPEPERSTERDHSRSPSGMGFMDASMKEDGFIPLNEPINQTLNQSIGRETRANESTPPFTTITSVNPSPAQSMQQLNAEYVCPCCGIVTPGGISYHEHVTQCYIGRFMETVKSNTQHANPAPIATDQQNQSANNDTSNQNSIHTLRSAVSNLDLHERIGLMEAFFRLSRTAGSSNQSGKQANPQTSNGQDNQLGDEAVISLLFSPTDDKKVEQPVTDPVIHQPTKQAADMTYRSQAPSPPLTISYNPTNIQTTNHTIHQPRSPARSPSASPSFNRSINQRNCLTPAMSPVLNQSVNQHTCLTPALNRWELDGKDDEYLQGFSLMDHNETSIEQPTTPPSAFKRARALSHPHVAYIDTSASHSPHMRSYSPVRVHIQPPSHSQLINPAWNLVDHNPSISSLSARRHSIGLMSNQSIKHSINSGGMSAVDGLTFNAGVVHSPLSTQSSPVHQSVNHSTNQHRLHQYLPIQPKHKRGKQMDSTRQSA